MSVSAEFTVLGSLGECCSLVSRPKDCSNTALAVDKKGCGEVEQFWWSEEKCVVVSILANVSSFLCPFSSVVEAVADMCVFMESSPVRRADCGDLL